MFAAIRSASSSRAAVRLSLSRPISSTPRLASSASSRHDNNPEVLQHEKARNLKGEQDSSAPHKDTAPGWNERLASDSEASVKADQAEIPSIEKLQEKTIEQTKAHHHEGGAEQGKAAGTKTVNPTTSEDAVKADRGEKHT